MNRDDLFMAIGEIDGDLVSCVKSRHSHQNSFTWRQFALAAACVALITGAILSFALPAADGRTWLWGLLGQQEKGSADSLELLKDKAPYLEHVIIYDGAYYVCLDMSDTEKLKQRNLPHEIREQDLLGSAVHASTDDGRPVKLYAYMPDQQAVYIAELEGKYTFAVFCNRIRENLLLYDTAQELFEIYGIHSAGDIECVEVGKKKLTSTDEIEKFYNVLCSAQAMGNDEWNTVVFGGLSEKENNDLCITLAETAQKISITSKRGMKANNIDYYPTINYIEWAINYYRLKGKIV